MDVRPTRIGARVGRIGCPNPDRTGNASQELEDKNCQSHPGEVKYFTCTLPLLVCSLLLLERSCIIQHFLYTSTQPGHHRFTVSWCRSAMPFHCCLYAQLSMYSKFHLAISFLIFSPQKHSPFSVSSSFGGLSHRAIAPVVSQRLKYFILQLLSYWKLAWLTITNC